MSNAAKYWLWLLMCVTVVPTAVRLSGCSIEEMEREGAQRDAARATAEAKRTVETTRAMRDLLRKTNPALTPAERCAFIARTVQGGDCLECADDRALVAGVCEAALDAARVEEEGR